MHTVVAADPDGVPIRVVCGFCQSEHNYRGGPRIGAEPEPAAAGSPSQPSRRSSVRPDRQPFPIVSERERIAPPIGESSNMDIEMILRRVIREEAGITPVTPAEMARRPPGPSPSDYKFAKGDIMSLNSGANYHGYIGDLCRMAIIGEPDAELKDLLGEIEMIQRAAFKTIKAGVRPR